MFLGLDVGMRFTKAVLWDGERVVAEVVEETRGDMEGVLKKIMDEIEKRGGYEVCCATGNAELVDFADVREDDVLCLAIAARDIANVDYLIDIGGQSITVLSADEEGNVIDFMRNDKCASGSGKFLEVVSSALGVEIERIDEFASKSDRKLSITSQCAVFAESEVISYVNEGERIENIIAAVCDAIAKLVVSQANRFGVSGNYTMSGGVAEFRSIRERIEGALGKAVEFPKPRFAAAIGAAIVAEETE